MDPDITIEVQVLVLFGTWTVREVNLRAIWKCHMEVLIGERDFDLKGGIESS